MTLEAERTTGQTPPSQPTAGRHLNIALAVISAAQLMLTLDELIVNTALPHIQAALQFSGTGLEWVVTAYALTFGGLLMAAGRAGDIFGRRRMFIAGLTVFSLASLIGGFAGSAGALLTARALQGTGAALAAPAALSLVTITFPEGPLRARAIGAYAAMTGVGGGVGLLAGGLLTTYASWRWVFFVNVPLGAAVIAAARAVLPESTPSRRPLDVPGTLFGCAGMAFLVYGLTHAATGPDGVAHWRDASTLATLTVAILALIAFVWRESHTASPLLPLRLLANRNRAGVYLILVALASSFFAMFFFVTLYLQTVRGYSSLRGGLAYLPFIATFILTAGINTKLVPRVGARIPITIGALLAPVGVAWLSRLDVTSPYTSAVLPGFLVFAAAAGLIFVPLTMTLVAGVAEEDTGIASSMFNVGQQLGGALGLAIVGSIAWTAVNNHLAGAHATAGATYAHALTIGVSDALRAGVAATLIALLVATVTIRVRREDLPDSPVVL